MRARTRYELAPNGIDRRNNKLVKRLHMQEEYNLATRMFRVHQIDFVYADDSAGSPLLTEPEWQNATEGNAKTLAALKQLVGA